MKPILLFEQWVNEERPEWHDSEAPDANGRFKELSPKELAAWLIDTRNGDVKRISGALTQQIVFNRNDDTEYADKMEKTREEVYKQLGREDLLESSKLEEEISDYEKKSVNYDKLYKNYKYKIMNVNKYSPNSYAERVVSGAMTFLEAMRESKMPYTLLIQLVKKLDKNFKVSFESVNTDMRHIMVFEDFKQSLIIEKAEGDRTPLDNPDIEKALKTKSEESDISIELLRIVMRRGMDAWNGGHRPGIGQEQWAYARVNSFINKEEGTWGGNDSDVAAEVK